MTLGALPLRGPRGAISKLDPFLAAMALVIVLATLLPARGASASFVSVGSYIAIVLLFFLNGVRLPTREAIEGLKNWKLHSAVLIASFVIFPILGFAARLTVPWLLTPQLYVGVMFLSTLPSTVQSSIAFTSIAKGNVGAAICAASLSNLLGIVLSPLLVALFLGRSGSFSLGTLSSIALQILVPFVAGQLLRRWLAPVESRHRSITKVVDRGSILVVVYSAFSASVIGGIWKQLSIWSVLGVVVADIVLLALVLVITARGSKLLGFSRMDQIAIIFCGSKKSLTTGVPIAAVQFAGPTLGLTIFPLMLFHQIQIIVGAVLASRFARLDNLAGGGE
ncbi:bile acid:sodium symporter family protein [Lacisediminihabitans profunda]|uniref:Bile acid:sodium symporter n=1 Tax=Lacisediminihabitans profunda TaxID=2594790 RepID=A0A5C8UL92_9MICO|nr:bile acid:sodium symporter family protein [Lacisediminihabitans profunda]TXN28913.1 bile acid:sodium symporter [Lacisediminihabitans profunda]